jgi:predicted nucleic acid-binding protein
MASVPMNCFVDTNVLIHAIDERSISKRDRAAHWLRELGVRNALVLSPQCLNEFYVVGSRKIGIPRDQLRDRIWRLARWTTAPLDVETSREAWLIEDQTGYHFWDCLLLASASFAGCRTFLSEDLQHERRIGPMTIINPFIAEPSDILSSP